MVRQVRLPDRTATEEVDDRQQDDRTKERGNQRHHVEGTAGDGRAADQRGDDEACEKGAHDADDAQDIGIGGGVDRHLGRGEHAQASGDEEPEGRKEDDQTCEAGDDRLYGIRTEDGDEGAEEGAAHRATERLTSHLGTEGEDEHDEDPWHESRRW